ncbi:MAG: BatA domain-containing protein [Flavobacteriia bacterium]
MKFEYPQFFFAFFLLLIPIIIHLFNFRKYKTLYFSSLMFVKQVNEETKSTQKLKHLLILITRLLAFSALIFAFAQPYKPVNQKGQSGYPFIGIYIDNSFSMSMKGAEGELLSMAKEKARNLIQKASEDTRFMLVTNNFEGFEQRLVTKNEALERLDKIDYSPLVKQTGEVIAWMKEGVSEQKIPESELSSKQLILLSDFQKNSSNFSKVEADKEINYYPIQFLAQQTSNLAIDSVWFSDPNFKIGINNEINVKVKNYSDKDLVNAELHLQVNETKRDVFMDIKAFESTVVPITYSDLKAGIKKGKLQINDKQMTFDDDYYFSYEVKEKSNVLIIDGEDAVPNVGIVYNLDKYYQTQSISSNSFTANSTEQKDLIILNGWNEFSSGAIELLYNFTQEGGTIALFPGSKLDLNGANLLMGKLNGPRFQSPTGNGVKIQKIVYEDPFFQGMFEKKPERLNLPSQAKAYQIGSKSGIYSLILLQNGSPLFFRLAGQNKCFVFASSLQESFGNFKSNALFSSVLLRIAETSQRRYPIALTIGSESQFPVFNVSKSEEPLKLKTDETEFIPEVSKEKDLTFISISKRSISADLKSGLYEIFKGNTLGFMALNYKRTESDVKTLNEDEIKTAFSERGIEHVSFSTFSESADGALIKLEKPKEYWRIFLVLALLFLLTEMGLLKWMK